MILPEEERGSSPRNGTKRKSSPSPAEVARRILEVPKHRPPVGENDEAERCFIGSIVRNPVGTFPRTLKTAAANDIDSPLARTVYVVAHKLWTERDGFTEQELFAELKRLGEGPALGYALEAMNAVSVDAMVGDKYAEAVRKAADERRTMALAQTVTDAARTGNTTTIAAAAKRFVLELEAGRAYQHEAAPLAFRNGSEIIELAAANPRVFLWDGVVASREVTLFAALPKAGKSSLLWGWLGAISRRSLWMGKPAPDTKAVVLSEETRAGIAQKIQRYGIDHNNVLILSREDAPYPLPPWRSLIDQAAAKAREIGAKILVVDTLSHWATFQDDDEQKAARVQEAFAPLQHAAREGLAVVAVHHARKQGGEHGTAIRGSGAFSATPDAVVEVRFHADADDPKRLVRVSGRLVDHAPPFVVELKRPDDEPHHYVLIGDARDAERDRARSAILEAIGSGDDWWTKDELEAERKGTGIGRDPWTAAIAALERTHGVQVEGGRKGNPKRYARIGAPAPKLPTATGS